MSFEQQQEQNGTGLVTSQLEHIFEILFIAEVVLYIYVLGATCILLRSYSYAEQLF